MPCESDLIYLYDGTYEGLLCCVFESVYGREMPADILPEDDAQPSLFCTKYIETDLEHARRVQDSISRKICPEAAQLVRDCFFSSADGKERSILRFLLLAYRTGARLLRMRAHEYVAPLYEAQRALLNEAHLILGFLRFSEYNGILVARIQPKHYVLPYLQRHFCERFAGETFLIFDKTHSAALVWKDRCARIITLESLETPLESQNELEYRQLWRTFSDTISIALRENPRCRMTHCPKRYWPEMLEMPGSEAARLNDTPRSRLNT